MRAHENDTLQAIEHGAKRSSGNTTMPALASAGSKTQKLKLVFGSSKSTAPATPVEKVEPDTALLGARSFPTDCRFTDIEAALPVDQLFELLRHQIHWATQENHTLEDDIATLEAKRKTEWLGKELVLENILEAELELAKRRKTFTDRSTWGVRSLTRENELDIFVATRKKLEDDARIARMLPMKGGTEEPPWYRTEAWRIKNAAEEARKQPKGKATVRANHVAAENRRTEEAAEMVDGKGGGDGEAEEEEDEHDDGDGEDDEDDRTRDEVDEATET